MSRFVDGLNVSASALTAQRLRMDIIAANIANVETTRGRLENGQWEPYTRKMVVLEPMRSFADTLNDVQSRGEGVHVARIINDPSPYKQVWMPEHPDADANGMVRLPNVDLLKEMSDMMQAIRAYEANVTAFNASKSMTTASLEIGR